MTAGRRFGLAALVAGIGAALSYLVLIRTATASALRTWPFALAFLAFLWLIRPYGIDEAPEQTGVSKAPGNT